MPRKVFAQYLALAAYLLARNAGQLAFLAHGRRRAKRVERDYVFFPRDGDWF